MTAKTIRRLALILTVPLVVLLTIPFILRAQGSAKLDAAVEAFEAEVGPLTLASYQPPEIERTENAGVWLLAATEATVFSENDRKIVAQLRDRQVSEWRESERQRLDQILEAADPALTLLGRSLAHDRSNFELNYSDGMEMPIPNFLDVLWMQRLVELKARRDLAAGDLAGFQHAALLCARSAKTLENESILISQLVGLSVEQGFLALVHEAVAGGLADPDLLRALSQAIGGIDLNDMVRRSMGGEASMLMTMNDKELVKLAKETRGHDSPALAVTLPSAGNRGWIADVLEHYRQISADLDRSYADLHAEYGDATATMDSKSLGAQFAGHFGHPIHRSKAIASIRHLARTAIALRLQAVEGGRYPGQLPDLEANPYTGEALSYSLAADGSASLEAENAADLYIKSAPERSHRAAELFAWTLPAPD